VTAVLKVAACSQSNLSFRTQKQQDRLATGGHQSKHVCTVMLEL